MAITLNAEQKNIFKILNGKDQYIIPPYQRAYSWRTEECEEFFEDLINAYLSNKNEGYFLGNIVIAKSQADRDRLEVIDGQQRLITITLFLKVLLVFDSKNSDLENAIWVKNSRDNSNHEQRLKTNVFEEKDSKYLAEVLESDLKNHYCIGIRKNDNNFKKNICYFYNELKEFFDSDNNKIEQFTDFLLYDVTLLPIETEDIDQNRAREKALKIFQTINNRGISLSDADIFKSNLYSMAQNELKQDDFIYRWRELDEDSDILGYSIERIFKIYSYQIRGESGIKTSEIGLRDFFEKKDYSPFKKKKYDEIMDELSSIVAAIKFFHKIKKTTDYGELSKWFQLIDIYTNNYPKDLLIVYLARNRHIDNIEPVTSFTKSLVRYCYFQGATTTVKNYIYSITIDVMNDIRVEYYPSNYYLEKNQDWLFNFFGRLYKGFGLLGAYLHPEQKSVYPYDLTRMRDIVDFWTDEYSAYDRIGNIIPTDLNKRDIWDSNKSSAFKDVNEMKKDITNWNKELHNNRQRMLQQRFTEFFWNPNENQ